MCSGGYRFSDSLCLVSKPRMVNWRGFSSDAFVNKKFMSRPFSAFSFSVKHPCWQVTVRKPWPLNLFFFTFCLGNEIVARVLYGPPISFLSLFLSPLIIKHKWLSLILYVEYIVLDIVYSIHSISHPRTSNYLNSGAKTWIWDVQSEHSLKVTHGNWYLHCSTAPQVTNHLPQCGHDGFWHHHTLLGQNFSLFHCKIRVYH